jgi:hypothetical protein
MVVARAAGSSDYFATPREVFQPEGAPRPAVRAGGPG